MLNKINYHADTVDKQRDVYKIETVSSGRSDNDMDALFLLSSLAAEKLILCKCQLMDLWKSAEKFWKISSC
jgi:hypothetical protein